VGDLFPPQTQCFQGEIFNTPRLCRGDFLLNIYIHKAGGKGNEGEEEVQESVKRDAG
jgi:hypothetical protein